jgi:hypothetical protein
MRAVSLSGQRRIYTSEDTGVEAVTVISERPIALQIRIAGLVPATFEPSGSVVTSAIKTHRPAQSSHVHRGMQ